MSKANTRPWRGLCGVGLMKMRKLFILASLSGGAATLTAQQPVFSSDKEVESLVTEAVAISVKEIAKGLEHPWGLAFLPDQRLVVTERSGDLRIVDLDGEISDPVEGVPEVFSEGQGGLLDVALDPDFERSKLIYLSFAEPGDGGASTALGRGEWREDRIENFEVIFSQEPKVDGPNHFGGRIVFEEGDTLFLTLGERFKFDPAQDLSDHLGAVVRIGRDGSIPDDNPFVAQADAKEEIWSYGHRNVLAGALHPETGDLWIMEMGPLGGDELNQPVKGGNYGWPEVSWGRHYDGRKIPDPSPNSEFEEAVEHYSPVISPSGMIYYTGDAFPEWQNSFFVGGLSSRQLVRLDIQNGEVRHEERLPLGERIRDVEQGPDGFIYVSTDGKDGSIWRLEPLEDPSVAQTGSTR